MKSKIEFIPPGFDPTTHEYTPQGPSCSGCLTVIVAVMAALMVGGFAMSYAQAHQAPTATATATRTATTTNTPRPTSTGTVTPMPTATITRTPTNTPTPTFIPPPTKVLPMTATPNDYQVQAVITATAYGNVNGWQYGATKTPRGYTWLTQRAAANKTQQAQIRRAERIASMTATPGG